MASGDAVDEGDLVRRAKAGEEAAFRALCERYEGLLAARVRRFVDGALRRKVSVLDVLQEAYLAGHQRLAEFEDRGEGAFGAWLAQIAEFKAREAVRRYAGAEKRAAGREVSRGARRDTAEVAGVGASPSQVAIAGERAEAVRRAMAALPDDHRHVLQLVQVDHLSIEHAAVLMGRSRDAVKKLYGRALSRLAAALGLDRRGRPLA